MSGDDELDFTPPELPYAGTSGHSGSDTSEDRARRQDHDGTTSKRQTQTMHFLEIVKHHGVTWKELGDHFSQHHGSASGVLSVLHLKGHIVRLNESRNGCKIYVLPTYVQGRKVEERRVRRCPHCRGVL